jgi:hypothetical protein
MSDALLRIGRRVLRGCAMLRAAPPEPLVPLAFAELTADPALLLAGAWSAALPQAAFAPRADAAAGDDAAFAPPFGDGALPSPHAAHAARFPAERRGPAALTRALTESAAASEIGAAANPLGATAAAPHAMPRRPFLTAAAPPQRSADERDPLRDAGNAASPANTARRRSTVALVRPAAAFAPAAATSAPLSPQAAPGSATAARLTPTASPLTGTDQRHRAPADTVPRVPASRTRSVADQPSSAPASSTRMVRGAAGLASLLGAHVTAPGESPAAAAPLAPQPPAPAPSPQLAPALAAPSPPHPFATAGPRAESAALAANPLADDDLARATNAARDADRFAGRDRIDADAVYDALESRLRGEFLRTYGSYGA